ncbi:MAG: tyrosinase/peptidase [Dehalococcoidia bacterium]|nr:tyrosinase/peptidase [Dehalococcoidia bacterium]
MSVLASFHMTGQLVVKASKDAQDELISVILEGTGKSNGDSQSVTIWSIKEGGVTVTFIFDNRQLGNVSYALDPSTGEWEIEPVDPSEADSLEDAVLAGQLTLENPVAELDTLDGVPVYRLTGRTPADAEFQDIVLWVGIEDSLIRQARFEGRIPASAYEGIAPQGIGELFQGFLFRLGSFNEPVVIVAPQLSFADLTVNGPDVAGSIAQAGKTNWFRFSVSSPDAYAVHTTAGTLADNYMYLYGPDSLAALIEEDDDDGYGDAARISLLLNPGTYYVRVRASNSGDTGSYTIRVAPAPSIRINQSDSPPGELLTIQSTRFSPDIPVSVRFFKDSFSISVPAVDTLESSITVAIPPYLDLKSGKSASAVVSIEASQEQAAGTVVSNTVTGFTIEDLPASTTAPGTVFLAYLEGMERTILDAQADLEFIAAASGGAVSVPKLQTNLAAMLNQIVTLKTEINTIVKDPSAKLLIGVTGDTQVPIQLSGSDLATLDGIIAARFIPIFQSFPLATVSLKPAGSTGGLLLSPLSDKGVCDAACSEKIKRWNELTAIYRAGLEQNAKDAEQLGNQLFAGGTLALGVAGVGTAVLVTAGVLSAPITAPVAILVGVGILLGTSEGAAYTAQKIRLTAAEIPGSTTTELEISAKKFEYREKAYMDGLQSTMTGILTGELSSAAGGKLGLLIDIGTNAKDAVQLHGDLTKQAKASPIAEVEQRRLALVTAVPGDPAPRQAYWVDVRVNPPAGGLYVTVTVHGTDGYTASGSASTDSSGYARVVAIKGGAEGVVDTVTAVVRIAAGGQVVGAGSTSVVF